MRFAEGVFSACSCKVHIAVNAKINKAEILMCLTLSHIQLVSAYAHEAPCNVAWQVRPLEPDP
jgi:hypothetical protein